MTAGPGPAQPSQPAPGEFLRLIGLSALIGIPAALVAALFLSLTHHLEHWLWDDLPEAIGTSSPPWYLVLGLPVAGALIVVVARRFLPGDGGHSPIHGLSLTPTPLAHAPGVVLAALGTLGFGAVLGPEAPVIALGSVAALLATRLGPLDERSTHVIAIGGSFAAISALFGGPLSPASCWSRWVRRWVPCRSPRSCPDSSRHPSAIWCSSDSATGAGSMRRAC